MSSIARRDFIIKSSKACVLLASPAPLLEFAKYSTMTDQRKFDVVIIGGSYAGLAAAMALGRALRNVLIIDSGKPCNRQTPYSHNFLTQDGKPLSDIITVARQQVSSYRTVEFMDGEVANCKGDDGNFEVVLKNGQTYKARKVIFSTGISDQMPNITGFQECWGISVLHCPYCHGYEVRGQSTGVLGNGESGFEFAVLLSNWTKNLTVYTNGASELTQEQLTKLQTKNIRLVKHEIEELQHTNGRLRHMKFRNGHTESLNVLYSRRPFAQHCTIPQSMGCEHTSEGYIKIDNAQKATLAGVFACGDNTTRMRTVANAVAQGTSAGIMVNKDLVEEDFN